MLRPRDTTVAPRDAAVSQSHDRAWATALRNRHGGSIAGRVTPTAATVCAAEHDRAAACVTTAADGTYAITLPPGEYTVWASAPKFVGVRRDKPVHVASDARTDGIDFTLAGGGVQIRGLVHDTHGRAIAGALVLVGTTRDTIAFATRTAADGAFDAWVVPGDQFLSASAKGFVDAEGLATAPDDEAIELVMLAESVIAGTIYRGAAHEPVAGATVTVSGSRATSGADGTYRLEKLEPNRYKPEASTIGGYGEAAESVRLGVGQSATGVDIEIHPVAVVVGRLVIDDGGVQKPCPDDTGWVVMSRYGSSAYYRAQPSVDGSIVLDGVVPGTYEVAAYCRDWVSQSPYPDLVVADSDVDDQTWLVRRGAHVTGRVTDKAGAPVPSAIVNHSSAGGITAGSVGVNPDGTFTIEGLAPGDVQIAATAEGYADDLDGARATVATTSTQRVALVLERGATIAGTVVDETGKPVRGVTVRANGPDSSSDSTGSDGGFEIAALMPGTYELALDLGWGSGSAIPGPKVTVALGKTERVTIHAPKRDGVLTGRVVDEKGQPIDDAYVDTAREESPNDSDTTLRLSWRYEDQLVAPDGTFTLDRLPEGIYSIRARRRGAGEAIVSHLALGSKTTLAIRPTGVLAGVVVAASGAGIADVTIEARDREHNEWRDERLFHTNGKFVMHDMPAGTYRIAVDRDVRSTITVTLGEGERRADLRLVAQPRYTVRGRLVSKAGAPLVGWKVEAPKLESDETYEGGRHITTYTSELALTDASGKFLLRDLPGGEAEISAADVSRDAGASLVLVKKFQLDGATTFVEIGDVIVEATGK